MQRTVSHEELLARLGLPDNASDEDVEAARAEIMTYLEGAPPGLGGWADGQMAAVAEASSLLSGSPSAAANGGSHRTRSTRRAGVAASPARGVPRLRLSRGAIAVLVAAAIAAAAVLVYKAGGDSSPSAATATTTVQATVQLDQAEIARLMGRISRNPKDVKALVALGDTYFQGGDFATASDWMTKAVALAPRNVTAQLGLGAALYNLGRVKDAERRWRRVVALDAKNVEAYYDLGFLYLSQSPPDMVRMRAAWGKAVEIAPNSDIAKTITTHLEGLKTSPRAGSPGTTGTTARPPGQTGG